MKLAGIYTIGLAFFVSFGCSNPAGPAGTPTDTADQPTEGSDGPTPISVSVTQGSASGTASVARSIEVFEVVDDTYFSPELKADVRGDLTGRFTPTAFVLDVDALSLYSHQDGVYADTPILDFTTQPGGAIVPRHINLIEEEDFIRDVLVEESNWDGIAMAFLSGMGTSNDDHYYMSFVGVDLGASYTGVTLAGEIDLAAWGGSRGIDISADPDLHYFAFHSLNPFSNDIQLVLAGADVTMQGIVNPDGGSMEGTAPPLFRSTAVAVGTAPEPIDFSLYERPEIRFTWDMNDLVEVYDNGTPDLVTDDLVTFALAKPFPLSLTVAENETSTQQPDMTDITPPADVLYSAMSGANTYNTLQWLNPTALDFSHVTVVRKIGSAPTSLTDGDVVYESHIPNYVDATGVSGTHYYYAIYAVDFSGNASGGVVLDQVQP